MKVAILCFLMGLFPAIAFSNLSDNEVYGLEGVWYDYVTDVHLEIKKHSKGIKVREVNVRRKKGWDTYYNMGRGVFDNCDGRALIVINRGLLKWKISRHQRPIILERSIGRNNGYFDHFDTRNRSNQSFYRNPSRNRISSFTGNWYCATHRLYLDIESYENGFRAKRPGKDWVYYEYDTNDYYRDNKGNSYYLRDGYLSWQSADGRDLYRFTRR